MMPWRVIIDSPDTVDVQMMVLLGGKQRTLSEFRALLEFSGFRFTETRSTAFLEAEPV